MSGPEKCDRDRDTRGNTTMLANLLSTIKLFGMEFLAILVNLGKNHMHVVFFFFKYRDIEK